MKKKLTSIVVAMVMAFTVIGGFTGIGAEEAMAKSIRKKAGSSASIPICILTEQPGEGERTKPMLSKKTATEKVVKLIQSKTSPKYMLGRTMKYIQRTSDGLAEIKVNKKGRKYKELRDIAKDLTSGCESDAEKIRAISDAISERVYYDWAYYEGYKGFTNLNPYSVWKNRLSTCQGYANLSDCMLRAIGIPAMIVVGDNHAYNAAYAEDEGRWIFFDATWCSGNNRTSEGEWQNAPENDSYFDMSPEFLASINNHEIYSVPGIVKGNTVYKVTTNGYKTNRDKAKTAFRCSSDWSATPYDQVKKNKTLRIDAKVGSYEVEEIREFSFYKMSHIRTIMIPKSIKKVGRYAFFVTWKGKQLKTKVITKVSKKRLNIKNGWGNRKVIIKRAK